MSIKADLVSTSIVLLIKLQMSIDNKTHFVFILGVRMFFFPDF